METKRRKRKNAIVLAVFAASAITASVAYMVVTTISGGEALEYYKHVDEALASASMLEGQRVRLHGNVVKGTIQKKSDSLDYRFAIYHKDRWTEVTYRGLVPDTFKDCAEVVVKGKFHGKGEATTFQANDITAKCPSKYDEKQMKRACGEKLQPLVLASRRR